MASGDSDGWVIIWSLASLRPVAVFKAHEGGVSGIRAWYSDRLISHGRDHKLRAWKIPADYAGFSTTTPVEGAETSQKQPWLVHSMDMSALNFCTFATCPDPDQESVDGLLIANPNGLDSGGIDIFQLPNERRVSQLHSDKTTNTGMVMSLAVATGSATRTINVLAGYEDGQVAVHVLRSSLAASKWERLALIKAHSQPVLSLGLSPNTESFVTSSADAKVVKYPFDPDKLNTIDKPLKTTDTKHAGQQGLSIRSDSKIFATAGWNSSVRVYSMKTMKELAVLKWHKVGSYATAFADVNEQKHEQDAFSAKEQSALEVIRYERSMKAQRTHWLAAGDKDGKISLWDVY